MSIEKAPKIWFKTARQVHQYLTCPVGEEFMWGKGETSTKDKGLEYAVSEKTIYNHVDDKDGKEKLKRNRAKVFAKRTVDIYAKTHLAKVVADADPGEVNEEELTGSQASAARRVEADAMVKEYDAKLKALKLKREMGQTVPTALVERELGERAQAFKLFLTSFIRDFAPELLSHVGGDIEVAKEIIEIADGDFEKAEQVSGFIFSRRPLLLSAYKRRLVEALNVFALGEWFTEDMREAWDKLESARSESEVDTLVELIQMVSGDPDKVGLAHARFQVQARGEQ